MGISLIKPFLAGNIYVCLRSVLLIPAGIQILSVERLDS
jgi:hypothetical protein